MSNNSIFADYWKEIAGLLVDGIVFGIFSSLHASYRNMHSQIKNSKNLGINPDPKVLSDSEKSCVVIHGFVKPSKESIKSLYVPDTYGVIQKFSIKNHAMARNATGFWTNEKHTIREAHNFVPFFLEKGSYKISIENPLAAEFLDLDTIIDKFEPVSNGFMDSLFVLFTGVRQQGIQTTEEMLKVGTLLTGVGELVADSEGQVFLRQPIDGSSPFILTLLPITSLLKKIDEMSQLYWWLSVITGTIGLVIIYSASKKGWKTYKRKREEWQNKERLEAIRRERKKQEQFGVELSDSQRCIICQWKPREIFILPCGHVCMCEECSTRVNDYCPMCRCIIERKYPAFIS